MSSSLELESLRESSRLSASGSGPALRELPASAPGLVAGGTTASTLARDSVAAGIINALVARGVECFFGIPGGPAAPLFEAIRLNPRAELVEVRHETHAAFAATAYHRSSGRVAAVVVTAGPGITNAVTGIASAHLEAAPMLVISGDVAWATHGGLLAQNGGPEGLHIDHLLASITRAQVRVSNGRSAISQACAALEAATRPFDPGPSLLVVPMDRARETASPLALPSAREQVALGPGKGLALQVITWLAEAERPLLVLGGACFRHARLLRSVVDVLDVPFVTTPRAKGVISEEHPRSLRNGGMAASLWARRYTSQGVDVALVLGTDLDDTSVGSTPYVKEGGRLVHVDVRPEVFNRNLTTCLGIRADLRLFCQELYQVVLTHGLRNGRGRALMRAIRQLSPYDVPGFAQDDSERIAPHRAVADLQSAAASARFLSDIGEHMLFCLHYVRATCPDDFHIQLGLGSMGSGIAGATGVALADRTRPVICICGDGGMQMSGMEILTSKKLSLPIVYAVFNDFRYNMVHHGMKQLFGEAEAYDVPQVDFSQWAASMDIPSRIIRRGGEISKCLIDELLQHGGPALLDIRIDPEVRIRGGGRVEALQRMSVLSDRAHSEA